MMIEVLDDADSVAHRAAAIIAAEARLAVATRSRFIVAVSGGKTPWKMLRALAGEEVPWEAVHVVQVDERLAALPIRVSYEPSCGGDRVVPAAWRHNVRIDFRRAPGAGLVFVDGRARLQHRIDDTPRLRDIVLARKQRGVAPHRVGQDAFVGVHLVGARTATDEDFYRLAFGL